MYYDLYWHPESIGAAESEKINQGLAELVTSLRAQRTAAEMKKLIELFDKLKGYNNKLADYYDAGEMESLSAEQIGVAKQDAIKRKATIAEIEKIMPHEDFEKFRKLNINPDITMKMTRPEQLVEGFKFIDGSFEKYSAIIQNAINSAPDKDAKRKEVRERLQDLLDITTTQKNDPDFWQFYKGYGSQIESAQKKLMLALSDSPNFKPEYFKHFEYDASEVGPHVMATALMDRFDNHAAYAAAKKGLPEFGATEKKAEVAEVKDAKAPPAVKPDSEAADKDKKDLTKGTFSVAAAGRFSPEGNSTKQDGYPVLNVRIDGTSPMKVGQVIEVEYNGKKQKALAVAAIDLPEGVIAEISTGLASSLGIGEGEQPELGFKVIESDVAQDKFTAKVFELAEANKSGAASANVAAAKSEGAPAGTDRSDTYDVNAGTKSASRPSTSTTVQERVLDLTSLEILARDKFNNHTRDDFTHLQHCLATLETQNIPELAGEIEAVKLAIATKHAQTPIALDSQGRETQFISTGASQALGTLAAASRENDGQFDLADAKRVLMATASAISSDSTSQDTHEVNSPMLTAIEQARQSGASAAQIVAATGGGAKPQNLVAAAAGGQRQPGE